MSTVFLLALVGSIVLGALTGVNVGLLCLISALAAAAGTTPFTFEQVLAGFPTEMFLTLVGATLLFSIARQNGSVTQLVGVVVKITGNRKRALPVVFFGLAFGLAALGAGNIVATALLASPGMVLASKLRISPVLMALMIANGANAGSLSPLAPAGIITSQQLTRMNAQDPDGLLFISNFLANTLIGIAAFIVFKGWRISNLPNGFEDVSRGLAFEKKHILTLIGIVIVVAVSMFSPVPLALSTFAVSAVLLLLRVAPQDQSIRDIPWPTILMISGVMVLVALIEKSGGLEDLTRAALKVSDSASITGWVALAAGLLSIFSSSTGVVLPTMLPLIPNLADKIPGVSYLGLALSVVIGSHVVDVSPFSTLGALCLAAVPEQEVKEKIFPVMVAWGFVMAIVGAFLCYLFFGLFGMPFVSP